MPASGAPPSSVTDEFELIAAIRDAVPAAGRDVILGPGDDAAVLQVAAGRQLVAATDTLVSGVHVLPDAAAADIGVKTRAVNLSDLAAMGAEPAWALLALTLPVGERDWVKAFAGGFAGLAAEHTVTLIGGDITSGPLSVTVTALGTVPAGQALTRRGGRPGDRVLVSGTLGDAALALHLADSESPPALRQRLQRPLPRVALGAALRGIANAAIDVSDGLVADLGHLLEAGELGAEIETEKLPASAALRQHAGPALATALQLGGGDDYELCILVAPADAAAALDAAAACDLALTDIGCVTAGGGIVCIDAQGRRGPPPAAGWRHFG